MNQPSFFHRLAVTLGLIVLVGAILLFVWYVADILLLAFVSILLAIFLSSFAGAITTYAKLPRGFSLAFVVVFLLFVLTGAGLLIGPRIVDQSDDLVIGVERALRNIVTTLSSSPQGRWLLEHTPLVSPEDVLGPDSDGSANVGVAPESIDGFPRLGDLSLGIDLVAGVFGILPSVLGGLANTLFVIVLGIFLAANPHMYQRGLLQLFPEVQRDKAREVLETSGHTLRGWLLAQLISMILVGIAVGLGLWLLGVPFALTLAFLAFLLEFIPIVGPFLSAVPGILIAFTQGWTQALWVTLFYLVLQQLEGNLLTPLIQYRIVHLPPALTLISVLIMGTLFGFVGLLVATPLLAVVMVLVKVLYLKDTLGQKVQLSGRSSS